MTINVPRRVRFYPFGMTASPEIRSRLGRAAAREFKVLEGVEHPGILKARDYKDTDRGPALIFDYDPDAVRLDRFIADHQTTLGLDQRLDMLRQLVEALAYAHGKGLFHRALAPQSIIVRHLNDPRPQLVIGGWQVAMREGSEVSDTLRTQGTQHLDEHLSDPGRLHAAPETTLNIGVNPAKLDVFSLGTLAWLLFTGKPPADSVLELPEKLERGQGLLLSEVLDGVHVDLEDLVRSATNPDASRRIATADEFLWYLKDVEKPSEGTSANDTVDPSIAKPDDRLEGGFNVVRRLGRGGSADVLVVKREGEEEELVLKVAVDGTHSERIAREAEVLRRLRHANIVSFRERLDVNGRAAILMEKAGKQTLAQVLRGNDPPSLDLMRRFGEELLQALDHLEHEGVPHRDVKPDNVGVASASGSGRRKLVLFDFSLSQTAAESIEAGTPPYLDPFLKLCRPRRWDLYAERYAAGVTLHEMLTGIVPTWGDGESDPAAIEDEATVAVDRFDPSLRDSLHAFFRRALRRDCTKRFGNAEEMLRTWRQAFEAADEKPRERDSLQFVARRLQASSSIAELGYGVEAHDVLDKMGIHTVAQLLAVDRIRFRYLRNVGDRVRKEIRQRAKDLANLRPDLVPSATGGGSKPSMDRLFERLMPKRPAGDERVEDQVLAAWLGIDLLPGLSTFPDVGEVARRCNTARSVVDKALRDARERWHKAVELNELRGEVVNMLAAEANLMPVAELASRLLAARGTVETGTAERQRLARGVIRAAAELEAGLAEPRFRLDVERVPALVVLSEDVAAWARLLGEQANALAREDPLPTPARSFEELAELSHPAKVTLDRPRLLKLAAGVSTGTALSGRLELYPRGMHASRALALSAGSLLGRGRLTEQQVRDRVLGRFPEAAPLPARPELDGLLKEAGVDREWRDHEPDGPGYYAKLLAADTASGGSFQRVDTQGPAEEATPEVLDVRALEEKLAHAGRSGGFMALTVSPRNYRRAEAELIARFPRERISLDQVLIEAMRAQAEELRVQWPVVLAADAEPRDGRGFKNLMQLVGKSLPLVRDRLLKLDRPALLVHPGLVARYDLMPLVEELRDASGSRGGPPGLWLLIAQANDGLPMIDNHALPVISAAQWTRLSESWLANRHRAGTRPAA